MVACVQLNKSLITSKRFTPVENQDFINKFSNKLLTMRIPDLKVLILGNYQQQKEKEFFLKQEILLGKSICDLNLNNVDEI